MSEPEESPPRHHWALLLLCALATLVSFVYRLPRERLHEDELEHVHTAWLILDGLRPYHDFFQIHPAAYWHLLGLPLRLVGPDPEVFLWARGIQVLLFFLAAGLLLLLARELLGTRAGLAAAALFLVHPAGRFPALQARPDPLAIALTLAGAWLYAWAWRREFRAWQAALAGALMGAGFATHPRAGFSILGLGLAIGVGFVLRPGGWPLLKERARAQVAFFAALLALIGLPFLLHGPQIYLHWVYRFSIHLQPSFPATHFLWRFLVGFGLPPLLLLGCLELLRAWRAGQPWEARWGRVAALSLVLCNLLGAAAGARPFPHALYSLVAPLALLAGASLPWLAAQLDPRRADRLLAALLLGCFLFQLRPGLYEGAHDQPQQRERIRELLELVPPGEPFFGHHRFSPIFRRDSSYWWLLWGMSFETAKGLDPDFDPPLLDELRARPPALVGWLPPHEFAALPGLYERLQAHLLPRTRPVPEREWRIRQDLASPSQR